MYPYLFQKPLSSRGLSPSGSYIPCKKERYAPRAGVGFEDQLNMNRILTSLGVIQAFVCLGAFPAGLLMMLYPDGSGLGIPLYLLEGSPFVDYAVPGFFLFLINGLFQGIGAVVSFKKKPYAGNFGFGLGILLMLWITIQVYFIGLISFLQPLYFGVGLAESILGVRLLKMFRKEK